MGARKAEAIVSYMIKQSLPAVSPVTSENFDAFIKSDKVVIVGFFDATDAATNEIFTAVANAQRDDFLFGVTNDAALAKAEAVKQPAIVLYKKYDEGKNVYEGKLETEAIQNWSKKASIPLIGEIGPETYSGYIESGLPLAYIFVENAEETSKYTEILRPVAEKYRGKINFGTIDAVQYGGHANNLNL